MTRLIDVWRALVPERRTAALISLGAVRLDAAARGTARRSSNTATRRRPAISAFQAFSFVEAAVLLVSAGVLALLFARAEGRDFQLPGGDGTIVTIAGAWAAILIFYRMLDKPESARQSDADDDRRHRVGHLPRAAARARRSPTPAAGSAPANAPSRRSRKPASDGAAGGPSRARPRRSRRSELRRGLPGRRGADRAPAERPREQLTSATASSGAPGAARAGRRRSRAARARRQRPRYPPSPRAGRADVLRGLAAGERD